RSHCLSGSVHGYRTHAGGSKIDSYKVFHSSSPSQISRQSFASSHRNTFPLIRRAFLSAFLNISISSSLRKSSVVHFRFPTYSFSKIEKGIGICPLCTAHFTQ